MTNFTFGDKVTIKHGPLIGTEAIYIRDELLNPTGVIIVTPTSTLAVPRTCIEHKEPSK